MPLYRIINRNTSEVCEFSHGFGFSGVRRYFKRYQIMEMRGAVLQKITKK